MSGKRSNGGRVKEGVGMKRGRVFICRRRKGSSGVVYCVRQGEVRLLRRRRDFEVTGRTTQGARTSFLPYAVKGRPPVGEVTVWRGVCVCRPPLNGRPPQCLFRVDDVICVFSSTFWRCSQRHPANLVPAGLRRYKTSAPH